MGFNRLMGGFIKLGKDCRRSQPGFAFGFALRDGHNSTTLTTLHLNTNRRFGSIWCLKQSHQSLSSLRCTRNTWEKAFAAWVGTRSNMSGLDTAAGSKLLRDFSNTLRASNTPYKKKVHQTPDTTLPLPSPLGKGGAVPSLPRPSVAFTIKRRLWSTRWGSQAAHRKE